MEFITCPLCGGQDTRFVFKRRDLRYLISEIEFNVVRCRRCGLVYINPRPSEEEIHNYYPDEFYEPNLDAGYLLRKLEWQLKIKYQYIKDLPTGKLLDVGCYKGEFMFYMHQREWNVQGIDFSAKPTNVFNLDIFHGELDQAGYLPESFDLITLWAVFEHVYNPKNMLDKMYSLLKPGGKIVLAVTNFNSIQARIMRHDDIPRHTTLFTQKTLRKMLLQASFSPGSFHYNATLYGGSIRGILNYLIKLAAGEKIEDVVAMNRSSSRWFEFSSQLRGKPSDLMSKIDHLDIALAPHLDRWLDKLHFGFIMVAKATKNR